ncbi:MAG: TAXI family TRAP transporter solute-binding subunit [Alphaproteobacteria bacterium]
MYKPKTALAAIVSVAALAVGSAAASEVKLPSTVAWTAYDVGTTGYNQAVGIGSVIKNRVGASLRVLPGKNDVSRMAPLREGKVQFSATGSDSVYAQEAMYIFGYRDWGPMNVRLIILNVSDAASTSLATAKDANIKTLYDLKGKRVAWGKGAPALNKAVESYLAFGNLTWDDVTKVEVGGYGASINALIEGQLDALNGATNSPPMLRIEASPRGLHFPPVPHDDEEGWKRLNSVVPWFFKHKATLGATIPAEGQEMANTAYPILVTTSNQPEDLAYNMTKAMVEYFDEYKDASPGANGWAVDRQVFGQVFLPYHDGALRFYKEAGIWKPEYQEVHERNLKRQEVVAQAWKEHNEAHKDSNDATFNQEWMKTRAEAFHAAGLIPIMDSWDY